MPKYEDPPIDCSRFEMHSAPPIPHHRQMSRKKLSPLRSFDNSEEFSAPDPRQVRLVLEKRISQALAGPSHLLRDSKSTIVDDQLNRRRSLIRSSAVCSKDSQLIQIDEEELRMLRSINKSQYSTIHHKLRNDSLYKHEYEDVSGDEDGEQVWRNRKTSLIRQEEQDDTNAPLGAVRLMKIENGEAVRTLEDRIAGFRHEKMRSSTRSGDIASDDHISGLVYDIDFDCYYNPLTDTYYRLKSKSGEGSSLQ